MHARENPAPPWSVVIPAVAWLVTWLAYQTDSAGQLAGLAALDGAAAVAGLFLAWRRRSYRGWAVAGAVASGLLVIGALGLAGLALLTSALSSLTF